MCSYRVARRVGPCGTIRPAARLRPTCRLRRARPGPQRSSPAGKKRSATPIVQKACILDLCPEPILANGLYLFIVVTSIHELAQKTARQCVLCGVCVFKTRLHQVVEGELGRRLATERNHSKRRVRRRRRADICSGKKMRPVSRLLSFPCACPEPVLANARRISTTETSKKETENKRNEKRQTDRQSQSVCV